MFVVQVHSSAQTGAVFHGADAYQVPVLDGVHVDIVGDAMLSAAARVRQTVVRRGHDGVRAQLAGHGGVFGNAVHPDPGAQPDHYSVYVRVHIRRDQAAAAGLSGTRQGNRKRKHCVH